jgi:hypothetical protein
VDGAEFLGRGWTVTELFFLKEPVNVPDSVMAQLKQTGPDSGTNNTKEKKVDMMDKFLKSKFKKDTDDFLDEHIRKS